MDTIYFAAPLFTAAEIHFNKTVARKLEENGYKVFLPQRECGDATGKDIFDICVKGIDNSDIVVAILDGTDHDSGTSWECGYATGKGKPVIGVRTDFRKNGDTAGFNAMLFFSAADVVESTDCYIDELLMTLKDLKK